ncbi:MAG: lysophospholipid acyltransferase family protein [Thermoflexaceae bacterium]|nr:lysophospholipid acyltransferase family protein [Thermoflexaceae bacterium]
MVKLFLLRLGVPLGGRFPWLFYRLAGLTGRAAWWLMPRTRKRVLRNLLPFCDGERDRAHRASKEVFVHIARYYVDLATLPRRDLESFGRDYIRLVNGERGTRLIERPGPIVVLSAHAGNPELAVQAFTYHGRPFVALVQPLEPPELAQYLLKLRSSAGGSFHEASMGGIRACIGALRQGQLVAMVADRDIQDSGVCIEMCGRRVKLPRGAFELARRTHATLLPILCIRDGLDHQVAFIEEPFCVAKTGDAEEDVRRAAQHWAGLLEQHIRRFPGQWKILEDFWKVHACGEG